MPYETLGSRRARARPQKHEGKQTRLRKYWKKLVAVFLIFLMVFGSLLALFTQF
jgi:hypothetical protein